MNTQIPLLGFNPHGNWLGMDSETLRDFADSFIDVDNFVSEEAIVSASLVLTQALIWIGYLQSWVYSDFKVVFEGLLKTIPQRFVKAES